MELDLRDSEGGGGGGQDRFWPSQAVLLGPLEGETLPPSLYVLLKWLTIPYPFLGSVKPILYSEPTRIGNLQEIGINKEHLELQETCNPFFWIRLRKDTICSDFATV